MTVRDAAHHRGGNGHSPVSAFAQSVAVASGPPASANRIRPLNVMSDGQAILFEDMNGGSVDLGVDFANEDFGFDISNLID
jgi:hypothetical protein